MSTIPNPKPPPTKPKKMVEREKERERERERKEKEKALQLTERLKVVVRRLPPNLPEAIFWLSVQPWVTDETITWKTYCPGKQAKRLNKENIPSRAYIAFKSEEVLAKFSKEYDGHLFRDKSGVESQAIVEFSPYQKIPTEKRKVDNRTGTIEKDEDFISFLESLHTAATREPMSMEALIASTQPVPQPKTTPLLEALKAEKSAHKDKEAILRNHAHYKDQAHHNSRKEDGKRKGGPKPEPPMSAKKAGKRPAQATLPNGGPQVQIVSNGAATASHGGKNGSPAQPTRPAKPPRPPRLAQNPKAAALAAAAQPPQPVTPVVAPIVTSEGTPTLPTAQPTANSPATPSRRPRQVGIASRHFEAALNSAGMRREREKEREREASKEQPDTAVAAKVATESTEPVPPSPRRERGSRGSRRHGGGGATTVTAGDGANTTVPSILQRNDTTSTQQLDTSLTIPTGDAPPPQGSSNPPGQRGFRGGRRGRGRGGPVAVRGS